MLSTQDIAEWPVPEPDHRISYGADPQQFCDLRLPAGEGPHPLVVLVHGGCWKAEYDLNHLAGFGRAVAEVGFATWSIEYRRVGNDGGGWPGTLQDVGSAADRLRDCAERFDLDVSRVVAVGHSAGGHLASWLAGRHRLPASSPLASESPLPIAGVVALAGIADLSGAHRAGVCGDMVEQLLGGTPESVPDRYAAASPSELLPLGVPHILVAGVADDVVPLSYLEGYAEAARQAGDDVRLEVIQRAAHFELIHWAPPAFDTIVDAIRSISAPTGT